jgi:protein-tyrosine phosphatase
MSSPTAPFRILFVCMGNICRSPAAEGIMKKLAADAGLAEQVEIDSAGTGGWHEGEPADARMRRHGLRRGYTFDSIARQIQERDFREFDLILIMDQQNLHDIRPFAPTAEAMQKVKRFTDYAEDRSETAVPDPYYGGDAGFEHVLDILENGCEHLCRKLSAGSLSRT